MPPPLLYATPAILSYFSVILPTITTAQMPFLPLYYLRLPFDIFRLIDAFLLLSMIVAEDYAPA